MTNLGTATNPLDMSGEQDVVEVRTDDPPNPEINEEWVRSDLAPEENQIATLRRGDGTDIPVFRRGTSEETVREARGVYVNSEWGYYPLAPVDDAAFPERRVYHDGAWHAYHNRVTPGPAITDSVLYYEGEKEDSWVEGFSTGNGMQSKEPDHLYLRVFDTEDAQAERTWVTDAEVNTSGHDTLEVEWAVPTVEGFAVLNVSSDKSGGSNTNEERLLRDNTTTRTTDQLDISEVNEDMFVRTHAFDNSSSGAREVEIEVYRVELI